MPPHTPAGQGRGLSLARDYAREVVGPLLERACPGVPVAAARLGPGSEVLGLDDDMSTDHDWGLRLQLFPPPGEVPRVREALARRLPETYRGHPVSFTRTGESGPRPGTDVTTVAEFAHARLGFDPSQGVTTADWLSVSGQAALEVTAGEVFADPAGELRRLRQALAWYPDDLWRYVIACDWQRLDEELPLMARAGDRGDELGSAVIAARLADVAVHLAFLLSRVWPPYSKWRGTGFAGLAVADRLRDPLEATLRARAWPERAEALRTALEQLADLQSERGLPTPRPAVVRFFARPYPCVEPSLVPALVATIADPAVRELPVGLGGIDQRTDNVTVLLSPARRAAATC